MSNDEVVERLLTECEGYEFIRFTWHDICGRCNVKAVPVRHLRDALAGGMKVWEGVVIIGPNGVIVHNLPAGVGTGNVVLMPQAGTVHALPWATKGKHKREDYMSSVHLMLNPTGIGAVLCETYLLDCVTPQKVGPRHIARNQLERLSARGITMYSGFELEVMMFDTTKSKPLVTGGQPYTHAFYHSQFEDFICTADKQLQNAGIDVSVIHMEYGPGQMEFVMAPKYGILCADQVAKCKQALREIAAQHDMFAVFMSKPFDNLGNGLHFSFSLLDSATRKNLFYDSTQPDNLTPMARHWLAGLVHHARPLAALCGPTVNCYRRYGTPWSPSTTHWNFDDRFCSFRMKNYDAKATYIENRLPSGSANPYVVMAATIAAGLDGVDKKMECPKPVAESEDKLPLSLAEAITCLKADKVLCDAIGEEFITWFLAEKEEGEVEVFKDWNPDDKSTEAFLKERDMYITDM